MGGSAKQGHGDQCTWQWQHWLVQEGAIGEVSALSQKTGCEEHENSQNKAQKEGKEEGKDFGRKMPAELGEKGS